MPGPPRPRVVTITVSDTRTAADDVSGQVLAEELQAFEHVHHHIVRDESAEVIALIRECASRGGVDAVILSGGTGIGPRDDTYEAVSSIFGKTLDGFGEAFRRLSWDEIGPRAILSRATGGTVGPCLVFALPGSPKAVRLGVRALIAPILGHAVDLVNGRTHHGSA